jgi:hypothetical protein
LKKTFYPALFDGRRSEINGRVRYQGVVLSLRQELGFYFSEVLEPMVADLAKASKNEQVVRAIAMEKQKFFADLSELETLPQKLESTPQPGAELERTIHSAQLHLRSIAALVGVAEELEARLSALFPADEAAKEAAKEEAANLPTPLMKLTGDQAKIASVALNNAVDNLAQYNAVFKIVTDMADEMTKLKE